MTKSAIYTLTGDNGQTGLVSGARVSKADERIAMYGEVDELNSRLGYVVALMREDKDYTRDINFLELIQSALFDLGSNLACEEAKRGEWKLPEITADKIKQIEDEIDWIDAGLPKLKNFILPGGTVLAAAIHLCRTSARSVERKMVGFQQHTGEALPANGLQYMNRLSDYFFVLARSVNKRQGLNEPLWQST